MKLRMIRYVAALVVLGFVASLVPAGDYEDAVKLKNACAAKKAAVSAAADHSLVVRADAKARYDQAVKDYAAKMGKMTSAQRKWCGDTLSAANTKRVEADSWDAEASDYVPGAESYESQGWTYFQAELYLESGIEYNNAITHYGWAEDGYAEAIAAADESEALSASVCNLCGGL